MEVLSKDMITRWLLPYLPTRLGGRRRSAEPAEVVRAICYKLKTGFHGAGQERRGSHRLLGLQGGAHHERP